MEKDTMRRKKTEYPVGATWRGVDENGMIGEITLIERNNYFEVWKWNKKFSDNSRPLRSFDWATSYRACHLEMNLYNKSTGKAVRMKRVK